VIPAADAKRLAKVASEHDPDVLDRVMLVYMEVAARLHLKIEKAVAGEALQHVIEEGHAGADRAVSGSVELEQDFDFGLARFALDLGHARARSAVRPRAPLVLTDRVRASDGLSRVRHFRLQPVRHVLSRGDSARAEPASHLI